MQSEYTPNTTVDDESSSEDEIFWGPVTEKERRLAKGNDRPTLLPQELLTFKNEFENSIDSLSSDRQHEEICDCLDKCLLCSGEGLEHLTINDSLELNVNSERNVENSFTSCEDVITGIEENLKHSVETVAENLEHGAEMSTENFECHPETVEKKSDFEALLKNSVDDIEIDAENLEYAESVADHDAQLVADPQLDAETVAGDLEHEESIAEDLKHGAEIVALTSEHFAISDVKTAEAIAAESEIIIEEMILKENVETLNTSTDYTTQMSVFKTIDGGKKYFDEIVCELLSEDGHEDNKLLGDSACTVETGYFSVSEKKQECSNSKSVSSDSTDSCSSSIHRSNSCSDVLHLDDSLDNETLKSQLEGYKPFVATLEVPFVNQIEMEQVNESYDPRVSNSCTVYDDSLDELERLVWLDLEKERKLREAKYTNDNDVFHNSDLNSELGLENEEIGNCEDLVENAGADDTLMLLKDVYNYNNEIKHYLQEVDGRVMPTSSNRKLTSSEVVSEHIMCKEFSSDFRPLNKNVIDDFKEPFPPNAVSSRSLKCAGKQVAASETTEFYSLATARNVTMRKKGKADNTPLKATTDDDDDDDSVKENKSCQTSFASPVKSKRNIPAPMSVPVKSKKEPFAKCSPSPFKMPKPFTPKGQPVSTMKSKSVPANYEKRKILRLRDFSKIVSPVAKYINEDPVPLLVTNCFSNSFRSKRHLGYKSNKKTIPDFSSSPRKGSSNEMP